MVLSLHCQVCSLSNRDCLTDDPSFHVESPPAFCTMAAQLRFLQFCFEGLNGFRGPMAPSTLPATSRPYIESGVSWKLSRVPCTLPV